MAIFRWPSSLDPWAGFRLMQRELERLVGRGEGRRIGGGVYPPLNVLNGPEEVVVQCEVPGLGRDKLELSITGETLVIKGAKPPSADDEKVAFQRRERGAGDFSRTVILPDRVDADRIEANLANGVLTVRLPKSDAAKPKRISVK